jgi:hypothetical protein
MAEDLGREAEQRNDNDVDSGTMIYEHMFIIPCKLLFTVNYGRQSPKMQGIQGRLA